MSNNDQYPLTEQQFRTLLENVFDEHLLHDSVDPECVNYEEAMERLIKKPVRYEVVTGISRMRKGDEALMHFSAYQDCGSVAFEVVCIDVDADHQIPIVRIKDYAKVEQSRSLFGLKRPTDFVPQGDFKIRQKSKTRRVSWIRRPLP